MAYVDFRLVDEHDVIWIRPGAIAAIKAGGEGPEGEDTTILLTGHDDNEGFWVVGALSDVVQKLGRAL